MPNDKDKNRIIPIVLIGTIIAISLALASTLGRQKDSDIRTELQQRTQSIAAALGPLQVMELSGKASDKELDAYASLKQQLAAVKAANGDVRSIYITGEKNGRLFFYVDSEKPSSPDYSPPAEWYDDATPEFKAIFKTNKPLVEGPVSDDFGTFISGLAPITKPASDKVVAVVGIDMDADKYWRDIILAAAVPLTTGLSLVLSIVIFEWMRRRNLQLLDLRSELVSVASHELRTPITGIRWGAESLENIVTDEAAKPYIKAIRNSAISLQASADDILELTHALNNRKVKVAPTDITKLVKEVFDTQQLSADQKGVKLKMDASVPESLMINCDNDKMKRVMHNMISNAVKYTREGSAVTFAYQQDETTHRLLISDQGIGIPATEQGKVLEGFYRASNAIASKVQGTGLGLYLVKTVLEQHGGKVSFISEEDKGTTFTLSIPKKQ
jgi:signal transduction histidine kinase